MKSYQFFKTYKCFDNEKTETQQKALLEKTEKTPIQQSMRKIKKLISWTLFYNRLFYYFASAFAAQFSLFIIRMMQEISKGEIGSANS